MIKPRMLGHVVIRVRDAQRSENFYTKVLGLEVRNRTRGGKMRFFTSNPEIDHELAVAEIGEEAVGPFPEHIGMYHMAWELANMDEIKRPTRSSQTTRSMSPASATTVRSKVSTSTTPTA